jgi:hypothetical protein
MTVRRLRIAQPADGHHFGSMIDGVADAMTKDHI